MTSLVVLGNCQVTTIEFLLGCIVPEVKVIATNLTAPGFLNTQFNTSNLSSLKEVDFVFIQKGVLNPADLQAFKEQGRFEILTFANIYFRGLHPDCCYVKGPEDRSGLPSFYHSVAVLDAYLKGFSVKKAVQSINIDNFRELGLLDAWNVSIEELKKRDFGLDFPVAEHVATHCRLFPGFLSVNHPSLSLMHDYWFNILRTLGLSPRSFNCASHRDPMEDQDVFPIHDFVAEYLGLPYRASQHWLLNHPGRRFVTTEDYVKAFYQVYEMDRPENLRIHSPIDLVETLAMNKKLSRLLKDAAPNNPSVSQV